MQVATAKIIVNAFKTLDRVRPAAAHRLHNGRFLFSHTSPLIPRPPGGVAADFCDFKGWAGRPSLKIAKTRSYSPGGGAGGRVKVHGKIIKNKRLASRYNGYEHTCRDYGQGRSCLSTSHYDNISAADERFCAFVLLPDVVRHLWSAYSRNTYRSRMLSIIILLIRL